MHRALSRGCLVFLVYTRPFHIACFVPASTAAGQKMDAVIGAVPKSTLAQTIEKYLE